MSIPFWLQIVLDVFGVLYAIYLLCHIVNFFWQMHHDIYYLQKRVDRLKDEADTSRQMIFQLADYFNLQYCSGGKAWQERKKKNE